MIFNFLLKFLISLSLFFLFSCQSQSHKNSASSSIEPAYDDAFIESSIGDASYLNPVLASDTASSSINRCFASALILTFKSVRTSVGLPGDNCITMNVISVIPNKRGNNIKILRNK